MTNQIHSTALVVHLLPFGMLLLVGIQTAQAIECSVEMPSNPQGHWSYRLIDGRKCWYQGENNLSKSLLRWPSETSAPSTPDSARREGVSPAVKENITTAAEKANHRSDPDACCRAEIEGLDSFETRWRFRTQ